ncbi:MAG: FeoB small GTPase domain-containing protein [Bacillota bacterium]
MVLVGYANAGKSSLLNLLCGYRALVSNYAGTTVETRSAILKAGQARLEVVDTPGLYSLTALGPEQDVILRVLETAGCILNVVDATDLPRQLGLTIQVLDLGMPVVVAVSQLDRARQQGVRVDPRRLGQLLGVTAVGVVAPRGQGRDELAEALLRANAPPPYVALAGPWEELIRAYSRPGATWPRLAAFQALEQAMPQQVYSARSARAQALAAGATCGRARSQVWAQPELWMRHPLATVGLAAVLLYMATVATSTLLEYTEQAVAALVAPIHRWLLALAAVMGSTGPTAELVARAVPEGLVVPLGTVLPAMLAVYLSMGLVEDSGLLARVSAGLHGPCSWSGIPGPGLIPLVLGTGCRAPAVLATRVLSGYRERLITCALVATVVPCAATSAVVGSLMAVKGASAGPVLGTMVLGGVLLGRTLHTRLPGRPVRLVLELPPLRWPSPRNILHKTVGRLKGFFASVLPLLVACNVLVRLLLASPVLTYLATLDGPAGRWFGLTGPGLAGLTLTVLQRYLAPLVLLSLELTARQATIAAAMICVSFPCLPVTVLCWRELGPAGAAKVYGVAAVLPVVAGVCLHRILP